MESSRFVVDFISLSIFILKNIGPWHAWLLTLCALCTLGLLANLDSVGTQSELRIILVVLSDYYA